MAAKNKVIAGEYAGKTIQQVWGSAWINTGIFDSAVHLDKTAVDKVEIVNNQRTNDAGLAVAGGLLFGLGGLIAGSLLASDVGVHELLIYFKNGKKSLVEVDDKIYKILMQINF